MSNIHIHIPRELGLVYTEEDVILKPHADLSSQINAILEWILRERISGINIPYLCDILPFIPKDKLSDSLVAGKFITAFDSSKDGDLRVKIAQDDMTAFLSIRKFQENKPLTIYDCYFKLLDAGVKRGFQSETLTNLIHEKQLSIDVVAARGRIPESGQDGEILFHEKVKSQNDSPHFVFEDIVTVVKDEIIAQKLPAKPGNSGYTVRGKSLNSPVHSPDFPPGENTYRSEGGFTLFAATNGHLVWDGSRLSVEEMLDIHGNVDFITGDIDYDGPVLIRGDVRSGLSVKATGDIEIKGCIEGANVQSTHGSIRVHSGINGFEKSEIRSRKNVSADYIQDAKVVAGKSIVVQRYISRSFLEASGAIRVTGTGGLVRGGTLWSQREIEVNVAGSTTCIPTVFMIKQSIDPKHTDEIEMLKQHVAEIEDQQQRIRRRLDYLGLLEQRQNTLSSKHQNEAHLLSEELIANSRHIMELEDRISASNTFSGSEMDEQVTLVLVHHKIYPGAKFIIGEQELLVKEEINGGKIQFMQGRIFLKPLNIKAIQPQISHIQISGID